MLPSNPRLWVTRWSCSNTRRSSWFGGASYESGNGNAATQEESEIEVINEWIMDQPVTGEKQAAVNPLLSCSRCDFFFCQCVKCLIWTKSQVFQWGVNCWVSFFVCLTWLYINVNCWLTNRTWVALCQSWEAQVVRCSKSVDKCFELLSPIVCSFVLVGQRASTHEFQRFIHY